MRVHGETASRLGSALHYAAQEGKVQLVMLLLSRGADPTVKDTKGRTVLQSAEFYRQAPGGGTVVRKH
jgi:ankyrin repeat protein